MLGGAGQALRCGSALRQVSHTQARGRRLRLHLHHFSSVASYLQVLATPQYSVTAGMATTTSSPSKGPFIGAQRGRAPPNVRGGSQVRCAAETWLHVHSAEQHVHTWLSGGALLFAASWAELHSAYRSCGKVRVRGRGLRGRCVPTAAPGCNPPASFAE